MVGGFGYCRNRCYMSHVIILMGYIPNLFHLIIFAG
jgi:hypothetical protein